MAHSLGHELDALETGGLVVRGSDAPEFEYAFKHSLVQETAYRSLLKNRRSELHREVAEAIEALLPAGEVPAPILAIHYKEAGFPAKAFEYAVRAGDQARRTYAHAEALANYDLALGLVPDLPPNGLAARLRAVYAQRGSILEVTGEHQEAEQNFRTMRQEAARLGDDAMQVDALNRLATVMAVTLGRVDEASELLVEALRLADQSRDLPMIARTLWNQGLTRRFIDPERATELFLQALKIVQRPDCQALSAESGVRELEGFILADLYVTHEVSGRLQAGMDYGRQALAIFRALDHKPMIADVLAGLAMLSHQFGLPKESRRFSQEGKEISTSIGNPWGIVYNSWEQLDSDLDQGLLDKVRDAGEALLLDARRVSFPIFVGAIESLLTRLYRLVGQPAKAVDHARAGLAPLNSPSGPVWSVWGYGTLGHALLGLGDVEAAGPVLEPIFVSKEGIIRGFQGYFVACPAILEYALARGLLDRGLAFADWILARFDQEGALRPAAEAHFWRGRLHLAAGQPDRALADFDDASRLLQFASVHILAWSNEAYRSAALARLGRSEEAASARLEAQSLASALVGHVRSPDLHDGFAKTVSSTFDRLELEA